MAKCKDCKKNASKKCVLTEEGICNDCVLKNKPIIVNYDEAPCNPDEEVGSIKFKDFVDWMLKVFVKCVKESSGVELTECKKEITNVKKELNETKKELAAAKNDIKIIETKLNTLQEKFDNNQKCTQDNLKYLINHDRNVRQRNVILFGVPDEDVVELGDESFDDDREAFNPWRSLLKALSTLQRF